MLEDFILSQKLESKLIVSEEPILSLTRLCALVKLEKEFAFKTNVFLDENDGIWICLYPWGRKLDGEKIKKSVPTFMEFLNGEEVEETTGYPQGFVPPISVYGANLLVDLSFEDKDKIAGIAENINTALILEVRELSKLIDRIVFAEICRKN